MALPFEAIFAAVNTIVSRVWPDKTEQEKLAFAKELQIAIMDNDLIKGQLEINKIEAASTNWFVAGARPAALWVCVGAMGWHFLGISILSWTINLLGFQAPPLPVLNLDYLMALMGALLGVSGMRSFDKFKGTAR